MAKLKKAPGRVIGRWKQEAIAANRGASDADLAKIINDMARKQGYAYTITPEKVRAKSKKKRKERAAKPASAADTSPVVIGAQNGFSRTFGGAGHAARLLADGRWIAQAAYRTRARSNAKPARPYIVRLMTFSRLTWPSTGPLLHACVRPA